jgi:hypothetical protein
MTAAEILIGLAIFVVKTNEVFDERFVGPIR